MTDRFRADLFRAHVLFVLIAAVIVIGASSCAKAQGFLNGIRSIDVEMIRETICGASQYGVGDGYHGRRTASGARFNAYAKGTAEDPFTVAYPPDTLARRQGWPARALGSWVTVTNVANGRSIRAKITDRGPFVRGRCVDLGRSGAIAIGMGGTARVRVQ